MKLHRNYNLHQNCITKVNNNCILNQNCITKLNYNCILNQNCIAKGNINYNLYQNDLKHFWQKCNFYQNLNVIQKGDLIKIVFAQQDGAGLNLWSTQRKQETAKFHQVSLWHLFRDGIILALLQCCNVVYKNYIGIVTECNKIHHNNTKELSSTK